MVFKTKVLIRIFAARLRPGTSVLARTGSALLFAFAVLLLASCGATTVITLNDDLSGTADIDLRISDILTMYYQDLTGDYSIETIVEEDVLSARFAERNDMSLISYEDISAGNKHIELTFGDINELVRAETRDDSVTFIERSRLASGRTRLVIKINEDTIPAILSLGPVSSNILSDYLLPEPGESVDLETYRDDLVWSLGDYAGEAELERLLDSSNLVLIVPLERQPATVRGGRSLTAAELQVAGMQTRYAVRFEVNIVEMLAMSGVQDFLVEW